MSRTRSGRWLIPVGWVLASMACLPASSQDAPFLAVKQPLRLLSANDGETHRFRTQDGGIDSARTVQDSITVIDLFPNRPPESRTVYGEVQSTLMGSPHISVSADGRWGFVTNHGWRFGPPPADETDSEKISRQRQNELVAIDLESPELEVVDRVSLPVEPWMVDQLPDGRIVVGCADGFRVFRFDGRALDNAADVHKTPGSVTSFDISPAGDRILAMCSVGGQGQIHLFAVDQDDIRHLHRVEIDPTSARSADRFHQDFPVTEVERWCSTVLDFQAKAGSTMC